jgi:hypothetical protein
VPASLEPGGRVVLYSDGVWKHAMSTAFPSAPPVVDLLTADEPAAAATDSAPLDHRVLDHSKECFRTMRRR